MNRRALCTVGAPQCQKHCSQSDISNHAWSRITNQVQVLGPLQALEKGVHSNSRFAAAHAEVFRLRLQSSVQMQLVGSMRECLQTADLNALCANGFASCKKLNCCLSIQKLSITGKSTPRQQYLPARCRKQRVLSKFTDL